MRTLPVKYSSGPLPEGCEPFLLTSISEPLHSILFLVGDPRQPFSLCDQSLVSRGVTLTVAERALAPIIGLRYGLP